MAAYTFITRWRFEAPVAAVWDEISHPERWPSWWRAVESVTTLHEGDADGVGTVRRYTWRGALPYRLTFDMRTTVVRRLERIEGAAVGDLTGRGCWQFSTEGPVTFVRYEWEVEATRRWMQLAAPVARPLFEWNHDLVMRWGFEGLARRLHSNSDARSTS